MSHDFPHFTTKFLQSAGSSSLSETTPKPFSSIRNAETDGANAVSTVNTFFQHKYARQVHPWVTGADQHIPALRPLGETTKDKWTSSPDVYARHSLLARDICAPLCQQCRTTPAGWGCFPCGSACGLHESAHGAHVTFRVVLKAEEAGRMAQPEARSPPSLPVRAFRAARAYPAGRPADFKVLTAPLKHAAIMVASAQAVLPVIVPAQPQAPPPPLPTVADAPPPRLPPPAAAADVAVVDPTDAPSDAASAAAMASVALQSAVLAYPATRAAPPTAAAEPAPAPAVSAAFAPPAT